VLITVDDDGEGIAEEHREMVFKPFYRIDSSRNLSTGGVGLGLAIARDIINAHGGTITLEESPAKGLRVMVRMPL
jgi:two-component system osmolarity sensor histidine kinase EnvZ